MTNQADVLAYVNQFAQANGLTYKEIRVWLDRQKDWGPWTTAVVTVQVELAELLAWAEYSSEQALTVIDLGQQTNIHLRFMHDSIELRLSVRAADVKPAELLPGVELTFSLPTARITLDDLRSAVTR